MTPQRWRVRRNRKDEVLRAGWNAWEPDGEWSGHFATWAGAMSWATDPVERLEYWLAHQVAH